MSFELKLKFRNTANIFCHHLVEAQPDKLYRPSPPGSGSTLINGFQSNYIDLRFKSLPIFVFIYFDFTDAVCTCMNTSHQCCQRAKGSRQHPHDNTHHYAGPSHNTAQPTTPATRTPHVIPYAQSEAYPLAIRGDKGSDNVDNLRGYMGLIKSRPEGDPIHPNPPNHPRPGITQAVNHEYHMPHHSSGIVGMQRINHPNEPQQTCAHTGGRSPDRRAPDVDPYYFKLDDSPDMVQPRSMMPDRNVPDLIANRPLTSKDLIQERSTPVVDERMTQRGGYDAIFVQDGAGSSPSSHGLVTTEESYDKLDRSRKSFRPRDDKGDYNTISLDVLKI